jgi:hypothetical protein
MVFTFHDESVEWQLGFSERLVSNSKVTYSSPDPVKWM